MNKQSFKLLLTQAQRQILAEIVPELVPGLKLGERNSRTIPFTLNDLELVGVRVADALQKPKNGLAGNSLRLIETAIAQAIQNSQGIESIPATVRLYQFKITLLGIKPTVWRRIQVRNCTLDRLHERIQLAMGWTNSHLYEFEINGKRCGDPHLLAAAGDDFSGFSSHRTRISDVIPRDGSRFTFGYCYDFGDNWRHEVLFEGCLPATQGVRYPICLEGERACPPEDVGGVSGYAHFLSVLANPKHEEHQTWLEWRGPFDPEAFDADKMTTRMRRGMPKPEDYPW